MRAAKKFSLVMAFILAVMCVGPWLGFAEESDVFAGAEEALEQMPEPLEMPDFLTEKGSYFDYLAQHQQAASPTAEIVIEAAQATALNNSGAYIESAETSGRTNALIWASQIGRVDWSFSVPETGLYYLELEFLALPGRQSQIELSLAIDGEYPFNEVKSILLSKLYVPKSDIERDSRGNDIRPRLGEVTEWQKAFLANSNNHYEYPYAFYLEKGEHTISLGAIAEPFAIGSLRFANVAPVPSYETYAKQYENSPQAAGQSYTWQAEVGGLRNVDTLYPVSERADAAAQPSDPVKTRMNVIGGVSWKKQGAFLEWEIEVPADGYYYMSTRVLQNYSRGMNSSRKLYIDGEVPFEEAAHIQYPYSANWYMHTLSNENGPIPVYFTAGKHTLRLEVSNSLYSDSLRKLEEVLQELNELYRRIVLITGESADGDRVTIDLNRDFQLEIKIPNLIPDMAYISSVLKEEHANIESHGTSGSEAAILLQVARQLDSFVEFPETIPSRLEGFKGNISALADRVLGLRDQPLLLDYFTLTTPDMPLPTGGVDFFTQVAFRWNAFIGSFTEDYTAMGNIYEDEQAPIITVWVCSNDLGATGISSGREQTQIIKELIDQRFVPDTGIQVNLSLIDGSNTLMQAILGGKGPDVAITVYKELPVNLAMRGALVDLSQFEGFDEIADRFYDSAMVPYRYKDGVYAVPETQNFQMIFYRKDIMAELGLSVPNTWDEFRAMVPVIQKQGMQVGIPAPTVVNNDVMGFQAQLFQRGLNYYTEDQSMTLFDQPEALEAFKAWTDLYTKYGLPVKYDFFTRFRTGTIPIAIETYTMANRLAAAAPELYGLWEIAPIPGTLREDGTIDRSEGATGTGAILVATSKEQESGYRFIDWWTSNEIQADFGLSVESLMGSAARWPTANKEAFESMKWSPSQQAALKEQWQYVTDIPQLPGNYITNRNIAFAFRAVAYNRKNAREVLNTYNKEINKEIKRKWEEFND